MEILHHGAVGGVTGSCHELRVGERDACLLYTSDAADDLYTV